MEYFRQLKYFELTEDQFIETDEMIEGKYQDISA